MTDPTPPDGLASVSGRRLLDEFAQLTRCSLYEGAAWTPSQRDRLRSLRAELQRRLDITARALAAAHCHPSAGSDPGECLVLHCELSHRDLIDRDEEIARLRAGRAEGSLDPAPRTGEHPCQS